MHPRKPLARQAIVLGGSVAGLLAARVLSNHFQHVIVLERDPLLGDGQPRKGTPQVRQTHGLLAGGLQAMERLLPGLQEDIVANGGESGDFLERSLWHVHGGWHAQFTSGLTGVSLSRPMLEEAIRRRVRALPNVTTRDQINVEKLRADEARRRITGVQVSDRREKTSESLDADLVVDATGRGSRLSSWLEDLRFPRAQEEKVTVDLTYATRLYRRTPGELGNNMAFVLPQAAPNPRFAVMLGLEGDRWSLTMGSMFGEQPPTDEAGLREFSRGLSSGIIHAFLQRAEPISDAVTHRMPGSLRRHYERLRKFPEGLLAMGDAMCSFNPIYGQGMTVAALEAEALDASLAAGLSGLHRRFFPRASRIIDTPWQIAVTADFQFRQTGGRKPWLADPINAYLRKVHQAAHVDSTVALAFHRVANLLDPPAALTHPRMVLRVLKHSMCRNSWPVEAPILAALSHAHSG